jgi:hypothetical protein
MAKKHSILDRLDPFNGPNNRNTVILKMMRLNKKTK